MQKIETVFEEPVLPRKERKFKSCPDVLTVSQVADLLSVCRNTVYKMIRENELPCRRIGTAIRIRKKDVMIYLNDR